MPDLHPPGSPSPAGLFRRLGRRLSLTIFLAAALNTPAAPANYVQMMRAKRAGKPNILLIVADDLGIGDLGCYGQPRIRTPNLDRLAGEGMRFTHVYAGSSRGTPSRAVLLTGRHAGHVPSRDGEILPLRPQDSTLAEVLQDAGYKTCAIGRWGLGGENTPGHPNQQGFDEWLGYLDATRAEDAFPTELSRNHMLHLLTENVGGKQGKYANDLFTDAAMNFVRSYARFPLFIYLAYTVPHANNALAKVTGNGMQVPSTQPYSQESWPEPERAKAAMITHLDREIGRLLAQLDELKLTQDTLVIFTSDNGPAREGGVDPSFFASAGPLRGLKGSLYEGGLRVPSIIRWPGRVPAGKVVEVPWVFYDLLPTLSEVAQTAPPTGVDGLSQWSLWQGKATPPPRDFLYWELPGDGPPQAARHANWKAVRSAPDAPLELYDLAADPGETRNVADQHPEVVQAIQDHLGSARRNP